MDMNFSIEGKWTIPKTMAAGINNIPADAPRFMLDRDQIFYSRAFRRLAGKTQLLAAGRDECLRTRLTHTLEVSQIARSIAQALGLDLDLVEAIVLGHDLGHTPFGHVGERTLHEIMTPDDNHLLGEGCPLYTAADTFPEALKPFLGFKHNLQSLVVAMELEKSTRGRGLNLTEYTLYGLQAHTKPRYKKGRIRNHDMLGYYDRYLERGCKLNGEDAWSLEALLVGQADEIAQWHHDLEDALLGGLITPGGIVEAMEPMLHHRREKLTRDEQNILLHPESVDLDVFTYVFTRIVIQTLMEKLTETAAERIRICGGAVPVPVQAHNQGPNSKMAHVLPDSRKLDQEMAKEIFSYGDKQEPGSFAGAVEALPDKISGILENPAVRAADEAGREVIEKLFRSYYNRPETLPEECMYAFFGAYHFLNGEGQLQSMIRQEFRDESEEQLRQRVYREGSGIVRQRFEQVFGNRSQTTAVEELLLMRTICNHIASMTDFDARRACRRICG